MASRPIQKKREFNGIRRGFLRRSGEYGSSTKILVFTMRYDGGPFPQMGRVFRVSALFTFPRKYQDAHRGSADRQLRTQRVPNQRFLRGRINGFDCELRVLPRVPMGGKVWDWIGRIGFDRTGMWWRRGEFPEDWREYWEFSFVIGIEASF